LPVQSCSQSVCYDQSLTEFSGDHEIEGRLDGAGAPEFTMDLGLPGFRQYRKGYERFARTCRAASSSPTTMRGDRLTPLRPGSVVASSTRGGVLNVGNPTATAAVSPHKTASLIDLATAVVDQAKRSDGRARSQSTVWT
jgi:hypothetical protein